MVNAKRPRALSFLLGISFFIGLLIAVFPLPDVLQVFRPQIICLLVVFWTIHAPSHFNVGAAALVGLIQDYFEISVWGAHMLALTVVAYICVLSYMRIRNYTMLHQVFWVFILVGIHELIVNWMQGLAGYRSDILMLMLVAAISAAIWPFIVLLNRRLIRNYRLQ